MIFDISKVNKIAIHEFEIDTHGCIENPLD